MRCLPGVINEVSLVYNGIVLKLSTWQLIMAFYFLDFWRHYVSAISAMMSAKNVHFISFYYFVCDKR